jgi:hypothetical protein
LACGPRGGYRLVVDSLHLKDVLQDSGIKEPGDAAYMDPTLRMWAPTEFARRWVQLKADEVAVLEGSWDRPGAVLHVEQESGSVRIVPDIASFVPTSARCRSSSTSIDSPATQSSASAGLPDPISQDCTSSYSTNRSGGPRLGRAPRLRTDRPLLT